MALWNERKPECAHQLTGETKGWKIASARAPTGLHRCAVCDKCLHTGPSRLLSCWIAAGYSSQNDPLYIANYGSLVRELRSTWIVTQWNITKRDAPAERDVRIQHRVCLKGGLSDAKVENPSSSLSLLSWNVGSMAWHSKGIFELLIKESPHVLFLQEARTTPHELRAMKHRFRAVVFFVLWDARHQLACIARHVSDSRA